MFVSIIQSFALIAISSSLPIQSLENCDSHSDKQTDVTNIASAISVMDPVHGSDPHGPDPHDEQHDPNLPANSHAGDGYPSSDPYNGSTGNNADRPYRPY